MLQLFWLRVHVDSVIYVGQKIMQVLFHKLFKLIFHIQHCKGSIYNSQFEITEMTFTFVKYFNKNGLKINKSIKFTEKKCKSKKYDQMKIFEENVW